MQKADPVLLEPIMQVDVNGTGGVYGRRYRRPELPPWSDPGHGAARRRTGYLCRLFRCARCSVTQPTLRSSTQGRGQYTMQPSHYAEVPKSIQEKIIDNRSKNND